MNETIETNLNQVVVEILTGARAASKDIYNASKEAVGKTVDFVSEQAPIVVDEFLKWQCAKAIIWGIIAVVISSILFGLCRKFHKYGSDKENYRNEELAFSLKWVSFTIACIIMIVGLGVNAATVVKIKVAPRVYMIDYVVDSIKAANNPNNQ